MRTEFTAIELISFDECLSPVILTRHTPQPPSKHINFVPVSLA